MQRGRWVKHRCGGLVAACLAIALLCANPSQAQEPQLVVKKIVLVAGNPSHGPGDHEFNAGCALLTACLNKVPGIKAEMHRGGWPTDPAAFDGASAILLYMDGGAGHPLIKDNRLQDMGALMKKGVGLVCAHYAVEIPKDKGGPELCDWIGGYYETGYSINPHWVADFKTLPAHPITRGVKPFAIRDEWYFNMRWRADESSVTPILVATPPDNGRRTPAAKEHPGRAETLCWCVERPDGGRGVGFTGGHFHVNWGDAYFRKLMLNALVWAAKGEVPADGIPSDVTPEELARNLDGKTPRKKN